jgi:hypothetical protein
VRKNWYFSPTSELRSSKIFSDPTSGLASSSIKSAAWNLATRMHTRQGMRVEGGVPERSQRAIDIMRSVLPEERRVSRVHLTIPASISCPSVDCYDRLAILRDVSTSGAFFYAELDTVVGSRMTLQFALAAFGKNIRLLCEGIVVRVERFPRGAATGFALQFEACRMVSAEVC